MRKHQLINFGGSQLTETLLDNSPWYSHPANWLIQKYVICIVPRNGADCQHMLHLPELFAETVKYS